MSKRTREVWHCDVCGWEWLPDTNKVPERCPNRECRKRNWNADVIKNHYLTDAVMRENLTNLGSTNPRLQEALKAIACSGCGGLNGLHQKGCKAKPPKSSS